MDQTLAKIYGTNEEVQDAEKLASAELAEKLAEGEELNLDGLSTDDLEALAQQVLSAGADEGAEEEQTEEQVESEDAEEEKTASDETTEAEEKLAEADYLGRVMAHSYVQELKNIEKNASGTMADYGQTPTASKTERTLKKAKETASGVTEKLKGRAKDVGEGFKDLHYMAKSPRAAASALKDSLKSQGLKGTLKGNSKALKALGVAGAGATAVGLGAKKMMSKKSEAEQISALDQLAIERAKEILAENGVELQSEEKTAALSEEQVAVLQSAVQARAEELLVAEGFSFEEDGEEETESQE